MSAVGADQNAPVQAKELNGPPSPAQNASNVSCMYTKLSSLRVARLAYHCRHHVWLVPPQGALHAPPRPRAAARTGRHGRCVEDPPARSPGPGWQAPSPCLEEPLIPRRPAAPLDPPHPSAPLLGKTQLLPAAHRRSSSCRCLHNRRPLSTYTTLLPADPLPLSVSPATSA